MFKGTNYALYIINKTHNISQFSTNYSKYASIMALDTSRSYFYAIPQLKITHSIYL